MKTENPAFAIVLLLSVLAVTEGSAAAQSPSRVALPGGVERVTSVEGITEYRLPNGLRVLLFPDPSKQTITVNVTYLVGSKQEKYGETGMAHLLEHLMFKGSKEHPDFPKESDAHFASFNGTTAFDRTNYFETMTATEENLKVALHLEADRMVNAFIARKDLDSEMTVVRNEFEYLENFPEYVLIDRVYSSAYLWHNYAKTSIGSRSDIENVPIDRLQAFYRMHYQPDNAVLLVAGMFDEARALELTSQYFAPIPRPARALPKLYTTEPVQDGERMTIVRRAGDVQLALAAYHVPSGVHPAAAAIQVLARLLADSPSGRLHKALVDAKKASRIINSTDLLTEPGLLLVGAEVRQDASLEVARDAFLRVIEGVATEPLKKEEVDRARNKLLNEMELRLNSPDQVGIELSEWISKGDWRLLFLHRDRLEKMTLEEVQQAAARYLKSSNRTLGLFIPDTKPDRAQVPAAPDVLSIVNDYKGKPPIAAGEAFDPSPANIHARTALFATPGGLKLALLPKKTRGNVVVANLTLRFGDEKSLVNRATAARLAGSLLLRGTAKHTRQQLQDELDRLKAKIEIDSEPTSGLARGARDASVRAFIETTRDRLPAVMKLLAEVLREPSFLADEFEQLRQENLATLEKRLTEPEELASWRIRNILSPYPRGDARYNAMPDEAIAEMKAVTLDEVKRAYADFFGAQNGELAVVGDFDDKATAGLADQLFGDWKSKAAYARVIRNYMDVAPRAQSIDTPDKENAVFVAGMNLNLSEADSDFPALELANWILGGSQFGSRLITRLRHKEGLSYGAFSRIEWDPSDKESPFLSFAICAPQNVAKVETAFREEVARALKDGFTAEEVTAGKTGWLQTRQVSFADDKKLARLLGSLAYLNRTPLWQVELEQKISALTLEQINAALRKYIRLDKLNTIKAGDLAKARAMKPTGQ